MTADKSTVIKVKLTASSGVDAGITLYSELLDKNQATFEEYDSAGARIGKFTFTLISSLIRENPYIITIQGRGTFFVNVSGLIKPEIVIYNSTGKVLKTQNLKTVEKAEVEMKNFNPGLYFYNIMSGGVKKGNGKVILE